MLVKLVAIWLCEACLNGEGQECHTPDCAMFLHRVDLPFHPEIYQVLHEQDSIGDETEDTQP